MAGWETVPAKHAKILTQQSKLQERREHLKPKQFIKAAGIVTAFGVIVLAGMWSSSRRVQAIDDDERTESKIRQGFEIAPVPLNLEGKNRALVGLGSYIVNAQADCDGCHSAGPATEFAPGGNPYLLNQGPTKINPATYLGGGRDFRCIPSAKFSAAHYLAQFDAR